MGGLLLAQAGKADPVTARVYVIFCNRLYKQREYRTVRVHNPRAAQQQCAGWPCLMGGGLVHHQHIVRRQRIEGESAWNAPSPLDHNPASGRRPLRSQVEGCRGQGRWYRLALAHQGIARKERNRAFAKREIAHSKVPSGRELCACDKCCRSRPAFPNRRTLHLHSHRTTPCASTWRHSPPIACRLSVLGALTSSPLLRAGAQSGPLRGIAASRRHRQRWSSSKPPTAFRLRSWRALTPWRREHLGPFRESSRRLVAISHPWCPSIPLS